MRLSAMLLAALAIVLLSVGPVSAGPIHIEQSVVFTPGAEQLVTGGYGMGNFWHAFFPLEPFTLNGPGDSVDVTVLFADGMRVMVQDTGGVQYDSVNTQVYLSAGSLGRRMFYDATWEFLDPRGDLQVPSTLSDSTDADGIGASFGHPIDLTNSAFSFGGVRYTFTLRDDPRTRGFPALFDAGMVAVQTQGQFSFVTVPDAGSSLVLLGMGLAGLGAWRKRWQ